MSAGTAMPQSGNLGDLLDRNKDPDKTALIDIADTERPIELSHGEIDRRANAVARALSARGYARGDRIAILAANSADYLIAYFGTMRAGLVSVPVNFKFPKDTIHYILKDSDTRLVFADAERLPACPDGMPVVELGGAGDRGFDSLLDPGPFDIVHPNADEVAMFLYTSGSTGRPKGVPLTHAGHLWVLQVRGRLSPDSEVHRFLVAAPLYHMNALAISKFAMLSHACEVLMPQFTAIGYLEAIARQRCTMITSVPTMMALVTQEEELIRKLDLSSVTLVRMGSAPATQGLFDKIRRAFPNARINYGYGTTEAGPMVFGPHPDGLPTPDLSIGCRMPEVDVRLVDGDNMDADQGELHQRCPAVMPGYHNMPEKTAEVMTGDGYYMTGDVMRRDADGFYCFVGRVDDMFVCAGENIYPDEVEKMLETHPEIEQACIVPVRDEIRGQKPVAFVVRANGSQLSEQQIKDYSIANAPAYQHPRRVAFVDELPLASTNKIDRKTLAEEAARSLA